MRKIEAEELKQLQLQIMQTVTDFCDKNGINYWLDCGTLLGAVRHKGFIPWDDDIDLGMLRPDFDKFMNTFNQENDRYKALCVENDPTILNSFIKVYDKKTLLYEPDEKGVKINVNIDVFVYDNAPDDDKKVKKMLKQRDYCNYGNAIRNFFHTRHKDPFKRFLLFFIYPVTLLFPRNYFVKRQVKISKRYANCQTKRVGNFTARARMVCDKSVFESFVPVEFEGKTYKAPVGYDTWLRAFYGDYMQLPPEEKRVPHHRFKAYMLEDGDEE